jgi:hypothetical protein
LGADTIVASMICPPSRPSRFSFFPSGEERLEPALALAIALVLQEPIKQIEQLFHRARLGQRLATPPRVADLFQLQFKSNKLIR